MAPREIARRFDGRDMYVQTYLKRGAASSSDDFRFLLDELNAYSHDLSTSVQARAAAACPSTVKSATATAWPRS